MALKSICPRCAGSSFEMVENPVKGSAFRLHFIRCADCGCVVGVQEHSNVSNLIYQLAKKLKISLD